MRMCARPGTSTFSNTAILQLYLNMHACDQVFDHMHMQARNDSTAQLLDTASPSRQPEAWQEQQPVASTSEDEEVPEEISARILRRILFFAGVPTFTGFVSLPLFWYLKVCCWRAQCSLSHGIMTCPIQALRSGHLTAYIAHIHLLGCACLKGDKTEA